MSDQVMEELWNGISPAANGTDLVNAVVDRLVELNIDLQDVSLSEMKTLMARAYRRKVKGEIPKRNSRVLDCVIAS